MKPKQLIHALAGRILWLAVLSLLIGMSSIPAQAQFAQFVYVANHDSNNISGFKINTSTGALTPVPGSPFALDLLRPFRALIAGAAVSWGGAALAPG